MMSENSAQQFLHSVPSAKVRVLIDMVNGLDVAQDHIRVAKTTAGSIQARLVSAITGETQQRNNRIAQSQQSVLNSTVEVITELAEGLKGSNFAIAQVANRLTEVENSLAQAVNVVVNTREIVKQLRFTVDTHVERLNAELARLDLLVAASEQLDYVISRWEACQFDAFPIASRSFIALHELYWGEFGEYLRQHSNASNVERLLGILHFKLVARLKYSISGDDALPLPQWLKKSGGREDQESIFVEGLAYLGANYLPSAKPWSFALTQLPCAKDAPRLVSQYCNADTLVKRVVREFFPDSRGVVHA